jgi:hypothetical protein
LESQKRLAQQRIYSEKEREIMPIEWNKFENDLNNYFSNYLAKSEGDAAQAITTLYVGNILNGADLVYGNTISSFNKQALQLALENAFNIGKVSKSTNHFSQMISQGLMAFWTGATLSFLIPPPGSTVVVSNFVNNPGSPQNLSVFNTRDAGIISRNLIIMFKLHMASVGGITTALVPTPTGPVPTPFPWIGFG